MDENADNVRIVLEEDQVSEYAHDHNVRRSTKRRTQSVRLTNYEKVF
jgi:hypothetical protein